ncbi:MAG: hypothetical protein ACOVQS_07310 [Chitinophagaceae bacterium]
MKILLLLPFYFLTCSIDYIPKPTLLNSSHFLSPFNDTIYLRTKHRNWDIELYGLNQSIPVHFIHDNDILKITPLYGEMIPSSLINLVLSLKNNTYVIRLNYENHHQIKIFRKFRSPKTLNTDSALTQYTLSHIVTENRNIISPDKSTSFFIEKNSILSPFAGTYNEDSFDPITSYYIQPGSPSNITLYITCDSLKRAYHIETNYLTDIYGNEISSGTLIQYFIQSAASIKIIESQIINGCSVLYIPYQSLDSFCIEATIGMQVSNRSCIKQ